MEIATAAVKVQSEVSLANVTKDTSANIHRQDILSDISREAFAAFTNVPGATTQDAKLKAEILSDARGNPYLPADLVPQKPEALSDHFAKKMAGLYNEIAVYQVAWNMAKRTGRDVETLLRGQ